MDATALVHILIQQNKTITTAESCTGGLIAATITDISGASAVFQQGFVTYSNHAKHRLIGVSKNTLNTYGAVSKQTASEMAQGALHTAKANIAIACTGIAGPTGNTPEKPIGLVYIAIATTTQPPQIHKHIYNGTRKQIRTQTVKDAVKYACDMLEN